MGLVLKGRAYIMTTAFHLPGLCHVVMLAARIAETCGHVSWKRENMFGEHEASV